MTFKTLDHAQLANQRVLLRVDLNVPVEAGRVTDDTRLRRLLPTLHELLDQGARLVLISHFGRPKGHEADLSLAPVAEHLTQLLSRPVAFAEDCVGPVAEAAIARLQPGQALVLENLRFHPQEEKNDPAFAQALARLGDLFVNDAFSVSHRAHASVAAVARLIPAYAGRLMQAELEALERALTSPARPVAALVGGSKISTKIDLLQNLVGKVNLLVLGGGMANTLLAARGVAVGKSLAEHDKLDVARAIEEAARRSGCRILLPVDAVVAPTLAAGVPTRSVAVDAIPADQMILDVGPRTVAEIVAALTDVRTLVWNGPLGAFETAPFEAGTVAVAEAVARLTQADGLLSVAGGGDTVAALEKAGVVERFSYVSTAGGAFLEWLEGRRLPGVAALSEPGRPSSATA